MAVATLYPNNPASSFNYFVEVSRGNVPGQRTILIRGHNPDIDTAATEDIWEAGGTLVRLTSAEKINIVSTSANDTNGGTGLNTILVDGIDSAGNRQTEVVTLSGVTPVQTVNNFLHVNVLVGASAGTVSWNVGTITGTADVSATIQCQMAATESISQNSQFLVPIEEDFFVLQTDISVAKLAGGGQPEVEIKAPIVVPSGVSIQVFDKFVDSSNSDNLTIFNPIASSAAGGSYIKLTASTETNDTDVRTRYYGILIENGA